MAVARSGWIQVGLRGMLPGFERRVWMLLGAMVVFRFGQGLYYPFSAIYFHQIVGIPLSLVGVALASMAVSSVMSSLVSGPLSDRLGRKPLLVISLAGTSASFFAFGFVDGFAGYVAVSVAAGLAGAAMFDAARNAMVADLTSPRTRGRAYGLVRVGGNVGWALGPMTAGFTAAAAGGSGEIYRVLFLGASALVALIALLVGLGIRESLPYSRSALTVKKKSNLGVAFSDGSFIMLLASGVLLYYIFTQNWQALPLYAKEYLGLPDGRIGLFLGANGVMVMLFQLPVAALIDRHSRIVALMAGAVLFGASSTILLLTNSFFGILISFAVFFTLTEMIVEVAGPALATELAPESLRGTYLALFGGCFGASYGISPIVAGALLEGDMAGLLWTIQILAATLAGAGLCAVGWLHRKNLMLGKTK